MTRLHNSCRPEKWSLRSDQTATPVFYKRCHAGLATTASALLCFFGLHAAVAHILNCSPDNCLRLFL